MLYHTSIDTYLEVNFALMHHHQWSLTDIESLIPWEREVYIKYLTSVLEKQKLEAQQAQHGY
tara:strand:+ start:5112 stop:5297 length:186 start_codon:yes stop_codon:yes gene_type:complete